MCIKITSLSPSHADFLVADITRHGQRSLVLASHQQLQLLSRARYIDFPDCLRPLLPVAPHARFLPEGQMHQAGLPRLHPYVWETSLRVQGGACSIVGCPSSSTNRGCSLDGCTSGVSTGNYANKERGKIMYK